MKKIAGLLFGFLMVCGIAAAQPRYELSVLTCSPDDELYAAFGHTGLRVRDVSVDDGMDRVYNFGTFDFSTPNFYMKFIKGDLLYTLSVQDTDDFLYFYTRERVYVIEQKLNLTEEQTDEVIARLDYLYQPENRSYRYQFTTRNCTTEVRDIAVAVTGGGDIAKLSEPVGATYRDYLNGMLAERPWTHLGINCVLGMTADREMNLMESMFLPDKFSQGLENMSNGGVPLAADPELIEVGSHYDPEAKPAGWLYRMYPTLICLIVLLYSFFGGSFRGSKYPAIVLFSVSGLIGCLLTFVMLYSEHAELSWNMNVLWCNPIYLIAAFAAGLNRPCLTRVCLWIASISFVGMLFVGMFSVQLYPTAFYFLAGALLILLAKQDSRLVKTAVWYR